MPTKIDKKAGNKNIEKGINQAFLEGSTSIGYAIQWRLAIKKPNPKKHPIKKEEEIFLEPLNNHAKLEKLSKASKIILKGGRDPAQRKPKINEILILL